MSETSNNDVGASGPHNIELEQQLLGTLLMRSEYFERVASFLKPEHFYDPVHQRLFTLCHAIFEQNRPVSAMTVSAFVSEDESRSWEDIGGRSYVTRLLSFPAPDEYIIDHANQLIDYWRRREMLAMMNEAYPAINEMSSSFDAVSDMIEETAAGLRQEGKRIRTVMQIGEAVKQVVTHIDTPCDDRDALNGLSTGLRDVDAKLGGLAPGEMIVIAGRPSTGKSTIALNIGRITAMAGKGVLYISPEMTAREFGFRILSDEVFDAGERIEYASIRRRWLDDHQKAMLRAAAERADGWPLLIEEAGDITIGGIRSLAKKAQRQFERDGTPLSLLVVDHIGLVSVPSARGEFERVSYISAQMKALAKTFCVPVIALSQLSRQVESREDKRPMLSDLRQSGSIEQDADIVMFPYRHEYYLERSKPESFTSVNAEADWQTEFSKHKNRADIIIAKNRNGPIGSVKAFCDVAVNAFRDIQNEV